MKNTHGEVSRLVKLQASVCNFTKHNTSPWVFSRFLNCANGTKLPKASHIEFEATLPDRYFSRLLYCINGTKSRKASHITKALNLNRLEGTCDFVPSQPAFTSSKLATETLEQGVKYVQS